MAGVSHTTGPGGGRLWFVLALAVAVTGAAGSLWLSIGMGLKACPLCFYQRTFVLSVVGILMTSFAAGSRAWSLAAVLSLPAAVGGLGVAAFHVSLEMRGALECPTGVLGFGTAPQQSLAMFVVLTVLLLAGSLGGTRVGELRGLGWVTALILGCAFTAGSIASAPPLPPPPDKPYDDPLTICRPPFRGA